MNPQKARLRKRGLQKQHSTVIKPKEKKIPTFQVNGLKQFGKGGLHFFKLYYTIR